MRYLLHRLSFATAAATIALAPLHAEQAKNVKGSATFVSVNSTMKENSDGTKDFNIVSENIVWITAGDKLANTPYYATCKGPGKLDKQSVYSGKYVCTYHVTDKDSYTVNVDDGMKGGTFKVTAGTGTFKDAKGEGTFTYTWQNNDGDRGTYDWEMKLTPP
jgi:hypothetical protein